MKESEVICRWTGLADGPSDGHTTRYALLGRDDKFFRAALFPEGRIEEEIDQATAEELVVVVLGVQHVDEDGLGWRAIPGEPGSFAVVDTKAINPKEETMAGATLTKEAQASGKSRANDGAAKDTKAEAKPKATKAKVKVRPIPDDYIKQVVKRVKAGAKYSEIEKEMIEAKTAIPEGYKAHYPAIRSAAIRHFGSVAAAREAAGKKNAA